MLIRCTHMFCLLQQHLLLHIITCKTSMLKFSFAVEFFTCALFKEYQKPSGTCADLIGLDSVVVNTLDSRVQLDWTQLISVGVYAPLV